MGAFPKSDGRLGGVAGLCALAALAAGCAEELGPKPRVTTRVSGVVLDGTKPVRGGWIDFIPALGTVGNMRSAPIDRQGRFEADDVAVGLNRIGISGSPKDLPSYRRSFDPLSTPIVRSIPPGPTAGFTIDLHAELVRQGKTP